MPRSFDLCGAFGVSDNHQARLELIDRPQYLRSWEGSWLLLKVMGWTPFVASMSDMQRPAEPGEASYTVSLMGETPICGLFDLNDLDICDEIPAH